MRDSGRRRIKQSSAPPFVTPRTVTPEGVSMARTKSRPISLPPNAALETVELAKQVPEAHLRDHSTPGIHVIPIDAVEDVADEVTSPISIDRASIPIIEIVADGEDYYGEAEEQHDLDLADLEEIPLPEPRAIGVGRTRPRGDAAVRRDSARHPRDARRAPVAGVARAGPGAVPRGRPRRCAVRRRRGRAVEQPRSATVTALGTSELLRIDRPTLSRVLGTHGDMLGAILRFIRDRLVDRWMRTSPLFRPMDDAQRADLAGKFKFLEIEAGTVLIGAGQRPDGLCIVLAGVFVVARSSRTVAQLGAGDLIGETALLSGGAFKSDVVAMGKSLALCLPASVFRMTHRTSSSTSASRPSTAAAFRSSSAAASRRRSTTSCPSRCSRGRARNRRGTASPGRRCRTH
jgi:CRP-like cAMP-binding protein